LDGAPFYGQNHAADHHDRRAGSERIVRKLLKLVGESQVRLAYLKKHLDVPALAVQGYDILFPVYISDIRYFIMIAAAMLSACTRQHFSRFTAHFYVRS
jgi:hypothetical protein